VITLYEVRLAPGTKVSRINTVRVEFFLTETQYLQLARRYFGDPTAKVESSQTKKLQLLLADGSIYPHTGSFNFIDRQVDPTTGAIRIQASFDNPKMLLRPGQFARVRAEVETVEGFSAHADLDELLEWYDALGGVQEQTFIVHGDEKASLAFAARLRDRSSSPVEVPYLDEVFELD
jgi:multidrug efflux pump subunit AcrA (membrane-fusion protein)